MAGNREKNADNVIDFNFNAGKCLFKTTGISSKYVEENMYMNQMIHNCEYEYFRNFIHHFILFICLYIM